MVKAPYAVCGVWIRLGGRETTRTLTASDRIGKWMKKSEWMRNQGALSRNTKMPNECFEGYDDDNRMSLSVILAARGPGVISRYLCLPGASISTPGPPMPVPAIDSN